MVAWIFLGFCSDGSVCVTQVLKEKERKAFCVEPVLREKERKKRLLEKPRKAKVSVRKEIIKKG